MPKPEPLMPCGCRFRFAPLGARNVIFEFCPLHASAGAMRAALQRIAEHDHKGIACDHITVSACRQYMREVAESCLKFVHEKGAKTK